MSSLIASPIQRIVFHSFWLVLVRVIQIVIIGITAFLFLWSVRLNYIDLRGGGCGHFSLGCPNYEVYLRILSSTTPDQLYFDTAVFVSSMYFLYGGVFVFVAALIAIKRVDNIFAISTSIMLVTLGVTLTKGISVINQPPYSQLVKFIYFIGSWAFPAFYLVFPGGRFVPRWAALLITIYIGWQFLLTYLPSFLSSNLPIVEINQALFFTLYFISFGSLIYRYRHLSNSKDWQATKWVLIGGVLTVGLICGLIVITLITKGQISNSIDELLSFFKPRQLINQVGWVGDVFYLTTFGACTLLLPLSFFIAIFQGRLWGVASAINRFLIYIIFSSLIIVFYAFYLGLIAYFFGRSTPSNPTLNFVETFFAVGTFAVVFQLLRERLQQSLNQLLYGKRDDLDSVLTQLGQQLSNTLAPDSVLQTIVETLANTMLLPYTAVTLGHSHKDIRIMASSGSPQLDVIRMPLTYQSEQIGELILAPRSPSETFSSADMKLINLIAQQAGNAAHMVRLNNELQSSRERLVTAQEEERRRLRRDLHDGVGPTLASLSQRIDTAADLVNTNPQASVKLLKELKGQVKESVAEIRRLVYALRPPVLDEFGLASAIREYVAQYTGPNGIQVTFDVTEPFPPLPAAVEVAAYRIAVEAFTNVIKHANARESRIGLKIEDMSLLLEVTDNGKGLPAENRAGIGFHSMRERANDLGGVLDIKTNSTGGVIVLAILPLEKEIGNDN